MREIIQWFRKWRSSIKSWGGGRNLINTGKWWEILGSAGWISLKMRTEKEERRAAECSNRGGRKSGWGLVITCKTSVRGCLLLRRSDSVTMGQTDWALEEICWQERYNGSAEDGSESPLVRRVQNISAAMSRRFAISNSGEAVEELTSNCVPSTSAGEGQDFTQQKGTLQRVSRAFHVPLLIG